MADTVCVIVGFGGGVSLGVARAFAKEGYTLALMARTLSKLEAHCSTLSAEGYQAYPFAADAGSQASLTQAFDQVRSQLGDPEVLIYNAAAFLPGQPTEVSYEQVISDFQVNVAGALLSTQQVIPAMREKGHGTILLTGGGFALNPWSGAFSLAIGKAGIRSLAFSLAQELAGTGIRVGTVTICGTVEPGTHFDPDAIAQSYLALHLQSPDDNKVEVLYQ